MSVDKGGKSEEGMKEESLYCVLEKKWQISVCMSLEVCGCVWVCVGGCVCVVAWVGEREFRVNACVSVR